MRRAWIVPVLLLLAGACTVGDETPTAADRSPRPGARPGGTLRVAIAKPVSIDPSLVTLRDPAGMLVASVLCDPPLSFDPVTGEPRPAVARRFRSAEGGRNITATLRRDVRLHDGSEAGAADVTLALSRAAHPETVSPSADLLADLAAFDVFREGRSESDLLPGVRAVGPLDVELVVAGQRSDLVRLLGHPVAAPLPADELRPLRENSEAFSNRPICSGPYRLAAPWQEGETQIRLVRFQGYYGENAAYTRGGAGYPDEILFRIYPDPGAQLEALRRGEVDVAHVPEGRLGDARPLGGVAEAATGRLDFVGLPTGQEPFDDRRVRVALSMALDREAVVERVYGGARIPAAGLLPPTLGEDLYREQACGPAAPLRGDVEGARRMLAGAGLSLEGVRVPLHFNDEFGHRKLMEEIGRQWREAFGIVPELRPQGWEPYLQTASSPSGFDGPFRFSWTAEYPTPYAYLEPLLHSRNAGTSNLSRFTESRFDRALDREARGAATFEDQALEYRALEDLACTEMPVIPVTWGTTHHAFAPGVRSAIGPLTDRSTGLPLLRELYLSR